MSPGVTRTRVEGCLLPARGEGGSSASCPGGGNMPLPPPFLLQGSFMFAGGISSLSTWQRLITQLCRLSSPVGS